MAEEPRKPLFGGIPPTTSGTPSIFSSAGLSGGAGFGTGSQPAFGANKASAAGTGGIPAKSLGSGTFSFGQGGTSTPGKFGAGIGLGGGSTSKGFDFGNANPASSTGGAPTPPNIAAKSSTTPAGPPPVDFFAKKPAPNNLFAGTQGSNLPPASASTQLPSMNLGAFSANKPTTSAEAPKSGLFASLGTNNTAAPPSAFTGFGQQPPSTNSTTQPASSKPSFGDLMKSSTTTAPPTGPSGGLFSFPAAAPSSGPPASSFTASAAASGPPTQAPLGGIPASNPTIPPPTLPASNTLFGGQPTSSAPPPSAPKATSTPAAGGLFTIAPAAVSSVGATAAPSGTASTATTTASTSAAMADPKASTSGGFPKPSFFNPAASKGQPPVPQSRLKNKTMDEILTRWASDLTKFTKEFQAHAETIADWDQILVDNMAKITKLYAAAVTSEKQTASIEMQLSVVENQQNELESWLDKYEDHVDEMLRKQDVDTRQDESVIDLEREKTYKTAEKLGERLEEMGRDLGTMIEEINAANTALSGASKDSEPITHIVRILNSHLSELQAIDQGTLALQAKVNAAMSSAQPKATDGAANGGAAVEDFYRSYLGRR